jgi:tripartite ATP-independent transporter DctP family solute receptor
MKLFAFAATLMAAVAGLAAPAAAQQTLRLGHNISTSSPYHLSAEHFARLVQERTQGRIRVQIFPAGALGNERDMIEGVQIGTIDMVVTSSAAVGPFVPALRILDVPFLFRDPAHARGVLDGPLGAELLAAMPARNLVGLAWGDIGFRHISANRPIRTLDDLRGLKLRSQNNPIHLAAYRALGTLPTVIGFNELYAALQTGVVDANEQPTSIHVASRFYEVQRHLTLTGHLVASAMFIISPASFNRLPAATQEILRAAARESTQVMRRSADEQDAAGLDTLRSRGMIIQESFDRDAFLRALQPAFTEFGRELGEANLRRIQDAR